MQCQRPIARLDTQRVPRLGARSEMLIPGVVRRNTLLLAATQALVGTGNQLVPALGALMTMQLLGTPALAGLATALLGGCRFAVACPAGYIADRYGRRASLLIGLIFSLCGAIALGIAMAHASFPGFTAGLSLFGLGVGIGQQLRLAAADMYPSTRRAEGLGYVLMGSVVGAVGGPLLVSLAQIVSPRVQLDPLALTWLLVPVVILPSIALVRFIRPDPKEIAARLAAYYPGYAPPTAAAPASPQISLTALLQYYPQRVALVAGFALHGNMSLIMAMTSLTLSHHGYALPAISVAVAIHVVCMYGLSVPLGQFADRVGRRAVLLGGTSVAAVGSGLVALSTAYWAITLGTILVGLGWSCMNVAVVALLADTTDPLERGRVVGLNDTFTALASIVLPLLAGPLVTLAGLQALAPASWCLLAIPFVLLLKLHEPGPGRYTEAYH